MKTISLNLFAIILLVILYACTKNETVVNSSNITVPTAPQNLSSVPGDRIAILTWQAPSNNGGSSITSYNIYRGLTSGGQTFLKSISDSLLTYIDSNLTNGTKYYYYITALNSAGESNRSNEAFATPVAGITLPTQPTNVTLAVGIKKVTISWGYPSNDGGGRILNYKIYRGPSATNLTLLITVDSTLRNYVDSSVINNNSYYYAISSVNSKGEGNMSTPMLAILYNSQTYSSKPGLNKFITNAQPVFDTINVNISPNNIVDIKMTLGNVESVEINKIKFSLLHGGVEVAVIDSLTKSGVGNFTNTVLWDSSGTTIDQGVTPYTGTFKPQHPLNSFVNADPAGNWIIKIIYMGTLKTGVIKSWSITIRVQY